MTDELDDIIEEIQTTSSLSAECRNALHACRTRHPWARGKTNADRKRDALDAISGKTTVNAALIARLERAST